MQARYQRYEPTNSHNSTALSHQQAIERVILAMCSRLAERLTLRDLAGIAHLSPYHFCRIFHRLTGVPPGEFLTALRLEEAMGLFPRPIPQGRPVACLTLSTPGRYMMTLVPDGRYFLLSAAFPFSDNQQAYHMADKHILVGRGRVPVEIRQGKMCGQPDLMLRPPRLTDPPVLVAMPLL